MPVACDVIAWGVLVSLLVAITVVDMRVHRIPNELSLALGLAGIAAAALPNGPGVSAALGGAFLGGMMSLAVALGFKRWRGIDGLGIGDVKFLAGAGTWTGWQGIGPVVFVAAATALLAAGLLALVGKAPGRHDPIAFGPYLCLALLVIRCLQQMSPDGFAN